MRVPVSWLTEYTDLPEAATARDLAARLIALGLEVETVDHVGADISGPIVVGRVLDIEELTGFKKPIRYCRVDVGAANGTGEPQQIVCGARNFGEGDLVVVALPGAELPGGFAISARKTYGRVSEGMICSASELQLWEDHTGIIVLDAGSAEPGDDAYALLGLREDVLDIAVTPDRGYALSIRGVAREAATAYGTAFRDPAAVEAAGTPGTGYPAEIADSEACDRFVLRDLSGFDPATPTPLWMRRRLGLVGIRSVSLAVDVTNYVMWELGQPLHAFDRTKLTGPIAVRRAEAGERLETLDHVVRDLDPDDILITDESGPISMAGTMGGLNSEIDETSTELVVEAAHFSAPGIGRMGRRHALHSEASRRFERGVDRELPLVASARAVELLHRLGGGTPGGPTHAEQPAAAPPPIAIAVDLPDRVAGVAYGRERVVRRLEQVGCTVAPEGEDVLRVAPPTWRPDLSDPNDLVEEVVRIEGYDAVPSIPPRAAAGRGLTASQRLRRTVGRRLAATGFTEVLAYPFIGPRDLDGLQADGDDPRRGALRLANPLSEDEPLLRTTMLPGLLKALVRNVGRGSVDVALYEIGLVYLPRPDAPGRAPMLAVDRGPTAAEVESLAEALPDQPRRVGAVLAGDRLPGGWQGAGQAATWADAIETAREVARSANAELIVRAAQYAPWHPGRCAALYVRTGGAERLVGHAGELHPRTVSAYGLPQRTAAVEIDLDAVEAAGKPVAAPRVSGYPVALQDVALVVAESVPAAEVEEALRAGAGELLESVRLFDLYAGEQVGQGRRSLAYALRFRAPDRTLAAEDISRARDAAVAEAAERTGAVLRA